MHPTIQVLSAAGGVGVPLAGAVLYADRGGKQAAAWQSQEPPPQQPPPPHPPPAVAAQPDDTAERLAHLTKLGELMNAGVLTQAEFEQQKARILGS